MTQKASLQPAGKFALRDVELPCDIFGSYDFYNHLDYTMNLFDALIMALTAEESPSHTLALLINSRLEKVQEVLLARGKADRLTEQQ